MAAGNSINDEIKEQKKKFSTLTFTEKIQYIWEYYRLIIAAVIAVVLVIISFVHAYIRNDYDTVCEIAVCDGKITGYDTDDDALTTGFTSYLGVDGKKERVHIDYSYNLEEKFLDMDPQVSKEKIYILSQTNNIDGYMCEYDDTDHFCFDTSCFLYDLNDLFTSEELEQLSDYLVYHTHKDGVERPVAIDISKAPKITETNLTMDRPCYGIVQSASNPENAADFIRFVFNMDKQ